MCLFETSPVNRPMSTNSRVYMRASLKPKHGGKELSGQRSPAPPVASRASSKPALKSKWFITAKITFKVTPSLFQPLQLNRAPAPRRAHPPFLPDLTLVTVIDVRVVVQSG